jgi:hypothetical protein
MEEQVPFEAVEAEQSEDGISSEESVEEQKESQVHGSSAAQTPRVKQRVEGQSNNSVISVPSPVKTRGAPQCLESDSSERADNSESPAESQSSSK